ncbi:MAG: LPS-assembly protein LptD [Geobacteraceae bacterium]|nr:LPS-assembly protein LptD [Geobacteraceae bacterium]
MAIVKYRRQESGVRNQKSAVRRGPFSLLYYFCSLFMLIPASLFAAEADGLVVRADKLGHEQVRDVITATGNVEIDWSGSKLYTDMASYFRGEERVAAKGNVRFLKGEDSLVGESAEFDIANNNGVVKKGTVFIKSQNIHMTGDTIEKHGEQEYRVENGTITSCDGEKPSWKFKLDDLKLSVDEFAYGKNAVLYLNDFPVFWFPYLIFPAKTERQSGFLIPKAGNSTKRGAFLEIPYYWAAAPNMDMTLTADLQSKRGVGVAVEHRYMGLFGGESKTGGYIIYDAEQSKIRGDIEMKQLVNFSKDTYWRADVSLTLDRNYFRDYGIMSGDYNRQYLGSTAFLSHRMDDLLLTGGVDYLNNLDAPNNRSTLQKLPFVTLNGTGSPLPGTPLFYSFATAVTNLDRSEGDRGQRIQLAPKVQLPFKGGELFYGSLWGGYNQRFYSADAGGQANGFSQQGLFEGGGLLRSELARVYDSPFPEFDRVRHLVMPEISYQTTERRNQSDLPFFDYDDRIVGGQLVTFSLLNTFTGRSTKGERTEYRDMVRFTLSQGYQLSGGRRDLLTLVDSGRPFTDTRLFLEVFPLPAWRLFTDTRVSPYNGNLTNSVVGAEIGDSKGSTVSVSYNNAGTLLDYMEGKVVLADFKPYTFSASGRYSFDKPGFLETSYSIAYKHQCWGVILSYLNRPDNKEITFMFNLSGLGNFKLL